MASSLLGPSHIVGYPGLGNPLSSYACSTVGASVCLSVSRSPRTFRHLNPFPSVDGGSSDGSIIPEARLPPPLLFGHLQSELVRLPEELRGKGIDR
ncbi:hypothetical protein SAY87_009019 [Trapa incisa]|uniref:Uncharacterized protein n=1 Tax=Trapa incisa TaxID=236973 RepID=A0AAN7JY28_9MYRT|nr:hypothetical protein SAY87_009019 [Trapa incisa]